MSNTSIETQGHSLNGIFIDEFIAKHPTKVARNLELMNPKEAAEFIKQRPVETIMSVWTKLLPGAIEQILLELPKFYAKRILLVMSHIETARILSRFNETTQNEFLSLFDEEDIQILRDLISYPENTAGNLMQPCQLTFHEENTVATAVTWLKSNTKTPPSHLFLLDDEQRVVAQMATAQLLCMEKETQIKLGAQSLKGTLSPFDSKEEIIHMFEKKSLDVLAVVDNTGHLLGEINRSRLFKAVKDEIATEIQTMVGANKDERALSSGFFTVRKRLLWLEINLVTAFFAALVVGLFEDTIARLTALAVLLPIAAGQSGNAGAQALAVTMRSLSLREITLQHWFRVVSKELFAGLINGLLIGITCTIGIYLWSKNLGLALVMLVAMVISMVIAGMSGALVPMILKRFGMDPAQSSSIILTTVTDIAGFFSFLGLATLFSHYLYHS